MPRLTITLSAERHKALKEAAVRRQKTIRSLVEESLDAYGVKTTSEAATILARARTRSGFSEAEALRLAIVETGTHRKR